MTYAIIPVMTFWKSLSLSSRTRFGIWALENRRWEFEVGGLERTRKIGWTLSGSPFVEESQFFQSDDLLPVLG